VVVDVCGELIVDPEAELRAHLAPVTTRTCAQEEKT
jgi:hypothetical protein